MMMEKFLIYYATSDARMYVATSTIEKLLDYVMNTPADGFTSAASVNTLNKIINNNKPFIQNKKDKLTAEKIYL